MNETTLDVGTLVVYQPHPGALKERGQIQSLRGEFAFVRYGRATFAVATRLSDLQRDAKPPFDPGIPTPYAVICPEHGRTFLSQEHYDAQMDKADARWKCEAMVLDDPNALGPCGRVSEWDDRWYEEHEGDR